MKGVKHLRLTQRPGVLQVQLAAVHRESVSWFVHLSEGPRRLLHSVRGDALPHANSKANSTLLMLY